MPGSFSSLEEMGQKDRTRPPSPTLVPAPPTITLIFCPRVVHAPAKSSCQGQVPAWPLASRAVRAWGSDLSSCDSVSRSITGHPNGADITGLP